MLTFSKEELLDKLRAKRDKVDELRLVRVSNLEHNFGIWLHDMSKLTVSSLHAAIDWEQTKRSGYLKWKESGEGWSRKVINPISQSPGDHSLSQITQTLDQFDECIAMVEMAKANKAGLITLTVHDQASRLLQIRLSQFTFH